MRQHQGIAQRRTERAVLPGTPADIALEVQTTDPLAGGVDRIDPNALQLVGIDRGIASVAIDARQGRLAIGRVDVLRAIAAFVLLLQQAVFIDGGQQIIDLDAPEIGGEIEIARR
ncbi:hypothetical protein D3C81_1410100 [compost metagenome]